MYKGLYNTRVGLSPEDARKVGLTMLKLFLDWEEWHHRRVERVSFPEEDAATRNISFDFTVPHWMHAIRKTPASGTKRQLVPLTLLRKQALINFSLRDESDRAIPLLTAPQTAQVAEAMLTQMASRILGGADVPAAIGGDFRGLVEGRPSASAEAFQRLMGHSDPHHQLRAKLRANGFFHAIAEALVDNFIALTIVDVGWHERKVAYLSYERLMTRNTDVNFVERFREIAVGRVRDIGLSSPQVAESASAHVEVTAPDALQIAERTQVTKNEATGEFRERDRRIGGHKRAHFHFTRESRGDQGVVFIRLLPEPTTFVRLATLAGILGLLATIITATAVADLRHGTKSEETAAAILLSFTAVLGLIAASSDGSTTMVRELLWPTQLLALAPVLWTFLAGLCVLAPLGTWATTVLLGLLAGAMAGTVYFLGATWFRLSKPWKSLRRGRITDKEEADGRAAVLGN